MSRRTTSDAVEESFFFDVKRPFYLLKLEVVWVVELRTHKHKYCLTNTSVIPQIRTLLINSQCLRKLSQKLKLSTLTSYATYQHLLIYLFNYPNLIRIYST